MNVINLINTQNSALPWLDLTDYRLWDFAGVDGLQMAKALFGPAADTIAPWRSLHLDWQGQSLSLLRLCENNFRIGIEGNPQPLVAALQTAAVDAQVWWRPCDRMVAWAMPAAIGADLLPQIAIAKLPHRLLGLPDDCALPGRIAGNAVVVWRHCLQGQSAFEIQTACLP
ncbi:MAG: hypothetical protein KME35_22350 [Aphanocapsa sp. GSE-SYN-MK-11-07L]|jgi:hypothetical protein|nr:hypothetical protein [Aphanocapsa sp. GSE-SYN-MK-11-07L]